MEFRIAETMHGEKPRISKEVRLDFVVSYPLRNCIPIRHASSRSKTAYGAGFPVGYGDGLIACGGERRDVCEDR